MRRSLILAVVVSALLVACSPSGVKQAEYDRVVSELASAKQQAVDLQSKLAAAEERAASAQSTLDQLQQEQQAAAKAAVWWQDLRAAWDALDAQKVSTFYAEDCRYQDPQVAFGGRDNIEEMAATLAGSGDRIEIQAVFGGTEWGAVEAIWYTTVGGRKRIVPYAGIYRLKDGKISQERLYWDDMLLK